MVQKARWNVNTKGIVGSRHNKPLGWDPNAITIPKSQVRSTAQSVYAVQNAQLAKVQARTLPNRKLFRAKLRELFKSPQMEVQEISGELHFSIRTPTGFITYKVDAQKRIHPTASSDWNAHSAESSAIQQKIIKLLKEM
jgi:hypothetical protein